MREKDLEDLEDIACFEIRYVRDSFTSFHSECFYIVVYNRGV